jgi:hypothetical protein
MAYRNRRATGLIYHEEKMGEDMRGNPGWDLGIAPGGLRAACLSASSKPLYTSPNPPGRGSLTLRVSPL